MADFCCQSRAQVYNPWPMNVRDTSREIYFRIKEDGTLSKKRWELYDIIYKHGPMTGNEAFQHTQLFTLQGYRHNVYSRLGELREMGVIKEVGTRVCSVTNELVILWDVTSNLPTKFEKKKSAKQIIAELKLEIEELKEENAHLRNLIEERNPKPQGNQFMLF